MHLLGELELSNSPSYNQSTAIRVAHRSPMCATGQGPETVVLLMCQAIASTVGGSPCFRAGWLSQYLPNTLQGVPRALLPCDECALFTTQQVGLFSWWQGQSSISVESTTRTQAGEAPAAASPTCCGNIPCSAEAATAGYASTSS